MSLLSKFLVIDKDYNPVHIIFHMALIPSRIFLCSNDSLGHNDAPKKSFKKVMQGKGIFCGPKSPPPWAN